MLAIQLDSATEERLERLVKLTGHTKSFLVQEAIVEHLEDLEDTFLATQRLDTPTRTYSVEEVKRDVGF